MVEEELVRRRVSHALVCEKDNRKAEGKRKWQSGEAERRCENSRFEAWIKETAGKHVFSKEN